MKSFIGSMVAALGLSSQPRPNRVREPEPRERLVDSAADLVQRLRANRTKHRKHAERVAIRRVRAKLNKPRRIRKAARAARKANRS